MNTRSQKPSPLHIMFLATIPEALVAQELKPESMSLSELLGLNCIGYVPIAQQDNLIF